MGDRSVLLCVRLGKLGMGVEGGERGWSGGCGLKTCFKRGEAPALASLEKLLFVQHLQGCGSGVAAHFCFYETAAEDELAGRMGAGICCWAGGGARRSRTGAAVGDDGGRDQDERRGGQIVGRQVS